MWGLLPAAAVESSSAVLAARAGIVALSAQSVTPGKSAAKAPAAPAKPGRPSTRESFTITRGGTYTGEFFSDNAKIPAITVATSEPVIIENAVIRSRGSLIVSYYQNADLTVRNTKGYALNPSVRGQYPGRFIDLEGFVSLTVENNYMESTSGIYVYDYAGDGTANQTIKVGRNIAKNIDGRLSNGRDGWLTGWDDFYSVCFLQLNGVQNQPGIEIAWNQVINEPGQSRVEDNISIFNSSGTPDSRLLIHDNYIQGAYAWDYANDDTYTGGGIMLSDVGSAWVRAYNNQVIATTNHGMAISSGHDNAFYDNRIVSAGVLPDGTVPAAQNIGAYIWNMNEELTFANNSGYDNLIGWNRWDGRADSWVPDAAVWSGNEAYPEPITLDTEAAEYLFWTAKLAKNKITIGPSF